MLTIEKNKNKNYVLFVRHVVPIEENSTHLKKKKKTGTYQNRYVTSKDKEEATIRQ